MSRQILPPRKMHILQCMCSKFCVKFQRTTLKFHPKFWTHAPQNMHFTVLYFCVWVTTSLNCDVISLGETDPWSSKISATGLSPQNTRAIMMTSSNGNIFRVTGPLCGEFTGPGEFPTQRPVTRSFDVFFDLRLNKPLSKQSWGWWFETLSWSLWRQYNVFNSTV